MQVSQREKDWAMAESRRKFVMDYTSNYNAAIRKGVEEGFRQGLEQGMQQGLEQAQAEIAQLKARLAKYESVEQ